MNFGIRNAGPSVVNNMWNHFMQEKDPNILNSFGYINEKILLQTYLENCLNVLTGND